MVDKMATALPQANTKMSTDASQAGPSWAEAAVDWAVLVCGAAMLMIAVALSLATPSQAVATEEVPPVGQTALTARVS
ncbi:hypothetical protein [Aliiroseovarius crassostreae]|uniref:Uncharacterized protein n=1 Tax=Aliiroseovarius crassostreae TaxID=154981 RepID=A0A9Q9LYP0_9RHOB|nr:hypothetical protein [Aliiroseovarius crassostreae]UWP88480.1 hypothetical protein K3J57_11320 [Aliiroseovarius crassostreae]UWP94789.1 hypothetical protein K3X48_11290 [Aliiroseovarius crassostreae]UWP97951.1 hypothetical protein K3X53_11300 [Aliiroseovarius crassostreae]